MDVILGIEPDQETLSDEEKLSKFRLDLHNDAAITEDQRDKANRDFRFIHAVGGQWEGVNANNFNTRSKFQLDLTSPFKNSFMTEWNKNRINVEFKPDDSATTDKDAENLNSVFRADYLQNSGEVSTDNAVDEIATGGYGGIKLSTFFVNPNDPEDERQRIQFNPIFNAYNALFWDSAAKRIDKADARWVTEILQYNRTAFETAFPGKDVTSAFTPFSRKSENVSNNENSPDIIYVGKRYEVVEKKQKVFVYMNLRLERMEHFTEKDHEEKKEELNANPFMIFRRERSIVERFV